MSLPAVLKHFNVFNEGQSCIGQVEEAKLPVLKRKMEDYRGGGMNGPVGVDLGQEALEMELTFGGLMRQVLEQYGIAKAAGAMLRFVGSYQADDTGVIQAVEVVARGRHAEIDMGSAKGGDKSKFVVKSKLTYFKLSIDGKEVIEIDLLNMIEKINGVDMLAEHRKALGMN